MARHLQSDERLRLDADAASAHVTAKADKGQLSSCTLAVLVVVLAALLPAADAAPAPAAPVWTKPCDIVLSHKATTVTEKAARNALKTIRQSLVNANGDVAKALKAAHSVYKEPREDNFQLVMEKLPKEQDILYKKISQKQKFPEKLVPILKNIHDGVQKFLAAVVWLQGDDGSKTSFHDLGKRHDFLVGIHNTLRRLQCMVQKAIVDNRVPLQLEELQLADAVDLASLPQPAEDTAQLILRDRAVIKPLQAFLGHWLKAVRQEMKPRRRQRHDKKRRQQKQQQKQKQRKQA